MCLAIPGQIKSIVDHQEGYMRMGRIEFAGIFKDINLELVPEAKVNDYVLVHVGVAISKVDEEEANSILKYLHQMDELDELYNGDPEQKRSQEEVIKKTNEIVSKLTS